MLPKPEYFSDPKYRGTREHLYGSGRPLARTLNHTFYHNDCGGRINVEIGQYRCTGCKMSWGWTALDNYNEQQLMDRFHHHEEDWDNCGEQMMVWTTDGKSYFLTLIPVVEYQQHPEKYIRVKEM